MATKVVMEALSPTMEEGRLVEWKKQVGDTINAGDVLAEVETDKAVMELVARSAGTLLKQLVPAGSTVAVSSPVGWIGQPGEEIASGALPPRNDTKPESSRGGGAAAATSGEIASAPAAPRNDSTPSVPRNDSPTAPEGRVKASPLARKIAADKGVDLGAVSGSGPEGRIIKRDLEGVSSGSLRAAAGRAATSGDTAFTDTPLTQIRKTIAKRLAQSIGPIPTFYLTSEVDMERVAEAREALNAAAGDKGGKISFNDIVLKAVATALTQHPACNAWWQDDHIRYWSTVHIGMAVAVDDGLITPVIRNAESKSLREISAETRDLAGRARERKLKPDEYTGSTFSVSNLGMFDIEHFTAIINPPEAGILAIGSIAKVPVVVNDSMSIRRRMRITMSCDHRVIDGATGAQFLKTLKLLLENPLAMVW
ncbi:MAG: 2-oxo acid dehydrogenase subunit E2 [Gemmatimonadales bacterium]|nr:2-oxo acid dehydrogenase subunit E2 [Gemmatimonadales bacterium]